MGNSRQGRINKILDLYFSRISDGSISSELETAIRLWFSENASVSEKYTALEEAFERWVVYNDEPSNQAIASWIDTMRRLDLPIRGERLGGRTTTYTAKNTRMPVERFDSPVKYTAKKMRLRRDGFWSTTKRPSNNNTYLRGIAVRVAAVMIPALVAVGVGFGLWWRPATPDMIVETVPAGQSMRQIQLPDGTGVWMRSGGRLEYPARFDRERTVDVSGDLFFDVAHMDNSAFIVRTDGLKVRVTGTKFNFSAHPGEHAIVTLHEGSVKVKADKGWVGMEQGEQFHYDVATGKGTTSKVDLNTLDWRTGELDFNDRTLGEIFDHISKAYGIAFDVSAPLSGERYIVSFFSHEDLSVVLSVLKDISGEFGFVITPEKVIINKFSE